MTFIVCTIFFLSGTAALIFETLWFRQAGLALGNSVWGAAVVLGGFMGGLALGNGLAARFGYRINRPIYIYAILEIIIALTGLSLVILLPLSAGYLAPLFRPFLDMPWILNPLRFSIAFGLMLFPTTCMGATLPVLVKALSGANTNFGSILGRLYGWNTLGAVTGALISEIVLIGWVGIIGAGLSASLLNFIAAFVAVRIESPAEREKPCFGNKVDRRLDRGDISLKGQRLLWAASLSGGMMLCLEVVWFRFLLLFKDGTSLVFAVMLAITLAGIGTGGLIASWWCRRTSTAHYSLRVLVLLSGILTVVTYRGFDWIYAFLKHWSFPGIPVFLFAALWLMFPVSLISGILFTMLGRAAKEEVPTEARVTGLLTLANTTGAMLGTFVAGFVLLPKIGMEKSLFAVAVCYGIVAFLIPGPATRLMKRQRFVSYPAIMAYLLCLLFFPFGFMTDTYFKRMEKKFYNYEGSKIVAAREGLTETVFYFQKERLGKTQYHRLVTNGFGMAATSTGAKRYMKLYVYLPVAVHSNLRHALLISYGAGSTAKALTDTKSLDTIDIVDISRDVLEMNAIVYPDPGEHPLNDERVRVHIEDGRFFLQTTDLRFDLITAEPPSPKHAGVVNLYSQEYFQLIYDRLAEGGIVTYWLPNHLLYEEDSKAIIKGFCNVFEDCSLWAGAGLDWMMVGTRNARGTVSEAHFSRQWEDPVVGSELRSVGFETPAQMGSLFIADSDVLKEFVFETLPLTDNYPLRVSIKRKSLSEFFSPLFAAMMDERYAKERFQQSTLINRMWPQELKKKSLPYFEYQRMIKTYFSPQYRCEQCYAMDDIHRALTRTSLRTLPLWLLGSGAREQIIVNQLMENGEEPRELKFLLCKRAVADRDYRKAGELLEGYMTSGSQEELLQVYKLYLYVLCMSEQPEKAEKVARLVAGRVHAAAADLQYGIWMRNTFGLNIPYLQEN